MIIVAMIAKSRNKASHASFGCAGRGRLAASADDAAFISVLLWARIMKCATKQSQVNEWENGSTDEHRSTQIGNESNSRWLFYRCSLVFICGFFFLLKN